MIVIICTIIALLLSFGIISCLYKKADIVTIIVQGIVAFLMCYAIVSSVYLMFNKFTIIIALVTVIVIELIIVFVMMFVLKRRITYSFDYRKSIYPLIIFLIIIPFLINKNGYLGVAQDAGVYQTRAVAMVNGYFDNYFTFDEYNDLTTDVEKQVYLKDIDETLTGFYRTTQDSAFKSAYQVNETTGILHGIHAYSAILALVGTIFGMSNMMYTGALFMFCVLHILYTILKNLNVRTSFRILGVVIMAFSPPVLWLFKTTLSETFLILIITEYVYFLTDRKNSEYMWLSIIPVITYAFFHVSIYVLMPVFVLIYYMLYVMTRKPIYILSDIAILIGYYAGFRCMLNVSSGYTHGNYKNLYILKFINNNNLVTVITIVTVAAILLSVVLYVVVRLVDKHETQVTKHCDNKISKKAGKIIGIIMRFVIVAGFVLIYFAVRKYGSFEYSSAYAYLMSTGVFLLPAVFVILFIYPRIVTTKKDMLVITMLFLYEFFLYSIMFIPYIAFYYYYARYIIIHIPVILIVGIYLLNSIFKIRLLDIKSVRYVMVSIAILFVGIVYKPYDVVIAKQQDQTSVSWEIIQDLSNTFKKDDAVVMSQEWSLTLKVPLKLITGADLYPVVEGDDMQQIERLRATHDNVYLMTEKNEVLVQALYQSQLTNIYTASNEVKYAEIREGNITDRGKYIPFVTKVDKNSRPLYLYK